MIPSGEKYSRGSHLVWQDVLLHNIAEVQEQAGETVLLRVPERIRERLNPRAQPRPFEPWGVELQYVADSTSLSLEISSTGESRVTVYQGDFLGPQTHVIDRERKILSISRHERMSLTSGIPDAWTYSPAVTRIALQGDPVRLHSVESGGHRPPRGEEVPAGRLLAYGTSITCGVGASFPHLGYAKKLARSWKAQLINLGTRGSAQCDLAMAEYMAERDDWDAGLLEISVNMLNNFSPQEFETKARIFLERLIVRQKPLICISVLPHFRDLSPSRDVAARYREVLLEVVNQLDGKSPVTFVDGTKLMTWSGLSADLLHPSDQGHAEIAENLFKLVPKPQTLL